MRRVRRRSNLYSTSLFYWVPVLAGLGLKNHDREFIKAAEAEDLKAKAKH